MRDETSDYPRQTHCYKDEYRTPRHFSRPQRSQLWVSTPQRYEVLQVRRAGHGSPLPSRRPSHSDRHWPSGKPRPRAFHLGLGFNIPEGGPWGGGALATVTVPASLGTAQPQCVREDSTDISDFVVIVKLVVLHPSPCLTVCRIQLDARIKNPPR